MLTTANKIWQSALGRNVDFIRKKIGIANDIGIKEIEFDINFNRELSEKEQLDFCDDFIDTIEKDKIYFGGGHHTTFFRGCLDLNESNLSTKQGVILIENFTDKYIEIIRNIEIIVSFPIFRAIQN